MLNFTQFSQNRILTMKYCSVKDCIRTSSCENVILHSLHTIFHPREYHGATSGFCFSNSWRDFFVKKSVKSNAESYHPALRTFALTLHLYSAQANRLVKHSLSSIKIMLYEPPSFNMIFIHLF